MKNKKRFKYILFIIFILIILSVFLVTRNFLLKNYYSALDFDIETIYSDIDFNNNGIDDYSDFLNGAMEDALNHPRYISKYYDGGYPPDNEGVCTDVIWRAFKMAGYSLKDMVNNDIEKYRDDYKDIEIRDENIDFRRVRNLHIFFKKYAVSLTLDYKNIEEFQPGDIVIFGKDKHIGIVSDRRNKEGVTYIIHNGGQYNRVQDYLSRDELSGHYRFDAKLIDSDILVEWRD